MRPFLPTHALATALLFVTVRHVVAQAAPALFEVATVRAAPPGTDPATGNWSPPGIGQFAAHHVTLALLLQLAYGVDGSQIANKPGWLESNLYDVTAKPADGIQLTREELRPRLQDLLVQRFHLVAHTELRAGRGYALLTAKGGPHLTPTKGDHFPGFRTDVSPGQMRGFNWSMPILAKYLTSAAGFPVTDQTGINGSYDIAFSYAPESSEDATLPALDVALKQATGLLLKPQTVQTETIVIDSVSPIPVEN